MGDTLKKLLLGGVLILVGTILGGFIALFLGLQIYSLLEGYPSGYVGDVYQQTALLCWTPISLLVGFGISCFLVIRRYRK